MRILTLFIFLINSHLSPGTIKSVYIKKLRLNPDIPPPAAAVQFVDILDYSTYTVSLSAASWYALKNEWDNMTKAITTIPSIFDEHLSLLICCCLTHNITIYQYPINSQQANLSKLAAKSLQQCLSKLTSQGVKIFDDENSDITLELDFILNSISNDLFLKATSITTWHQSQNTDIILNAI